MSLKDIPNMTAQQVFDIVATHLLTQMKRSLSFDDECMYRGSNGLKCAAGALIDDDEYSENMEHRSWQQLTRARRVPLAHLKLIQGLQCIHDNSDPKFWYEALVKTAKDLGLEFNHEEPLQNQ